MKVKWLRLALSDIEEIAQYISKENPDAAHKVIRLIYNKIYFLISHPNIGRPGRVFGTRELYIEGTPFIVPYRISNNEIQIIRVLHGARKWPDSL
jgi:addiction module RelE/StbE family toxin